MAKTRKKRSFFQKNHAFRGEVCGGLRAKSTTKVLVELAAFGKRHIGPDRGTGEFRFAPGLQALSDFLSKPKI
jgi:hypothetical protein